MVNILHYPASRSNIFKNEFQVCAEVRLLIEKEVTHVAATELGIEVFTLQRKFLFTNPTEEFIHYLSDRRKVPDLDRE
jgi:hypothetical protein